MVDLMTPEAIEQMARERGMTVPELCRRAGVAHTTFYRWKAGEHEPTLGVYRRLRDAAAGTSGESAPEPAPPSPHSAEAA